MLAREKDQVEVLKTALEQEKDAIKRQSFALRSLPEDYEYLQQEVQKLSEGKSFAWGYCLYVTLCLFLLAYLVRRSRISCVSRDIVDGLLFNVTYNGSVGYLRTLVRLSVNRVHCPVAFFNVKSSCMSVPFVIY